MCKAKIKILVIVSMLTQLGFMLSCKKDPGINPPPVIQAQPAPVAVQVIIYPNPSTGSFTIQTNTPASQSVQMFNMLGRMVLTETINGTTTVNADSLPAGVYLIRIGSSPANLINRKIIIQK